LWEESRYALLGSAPAYWRRSAMNSSTVMPPSRIRARKVPLALSVIGNGEAAVRGLRLPEDDVAPPLPIDLVSEPTKGSHRLASRDPR
jgi:hypothetical protein